MTEQLQLIPHREPSWPLAEDVRLAGLAGVHQARAALQAASTRQHDGDRAPDAGRASDADRSAA